MNATDNSPKHRGKLTDAQVEELKLKHGTIYELEVPHGPEDDAVRSYGYLKPATESVLAIATAIDNPIRMKACLLDKLWIEGDDCLLQPDHLLRLKALMVVDEVVDLRGAVLKKK